MAVKSPTSQRGWTPSQDLQPSWKGKEPVRLSASDGASTDRNNTGSESTDPDEPVSTAQESPPELFSSSSLETTGNDGMGNSDQRQIEELKEELAKEKSKRGSLEARISELEAIVNNTREERRRWESESITQLTPADLLNGKNKEWQDIFNNLTKRYEESVNRKHEV